LPIYKLLEPIATDIRHQTNIDGYMRLLLEQQKFLLTKKVLPSFEEVGRTATTIIESKLQSVFELGEKFIFACQKEFTKGIIGPFALQCVTRSGLIEKQFVVYDFLSEYLVLLELKPLHTVSIFLADQLAWAK